MNSWNVVAIANTLTKCTTIQKTFNGSSTDGSFITAVSNLFLSPLEKIAWLQIWDNSVWFSFLYWKWIWGDSNIFLSGIGDPFLHQNIRYHCPVYCVFNFEKCNSGVFTRNIWLYDRGNYEALSSELNETNWNSLKNDDINIYAQNITDKIITAAKRHIPNENIKVRQSDPPWLNNTIKKMIRERKRLFNKFKSTRNDIDFQNL